MKNILIIQGSGRPKGNTAQLVEHFVKGVEDAAIRMVSRRLIKQTI